jgi:hypothetical protein
MSEPAGRRSTEAKYGQQANGPPSISVKSFRRASRCRIRSPRCLCGSTQHRRASGQVRAPHHPAGPDEAVTMDDCTEMEDPFPGNKPLADRCG